MHPICLEQERDEMENELAALHYVRLSLVDGNLDRRRR